MIIMAVDHSSGLIARQHASEFWAGAMSAYTSAFPFFTRWITHLCAPGFFFLMGAGAYWFASSRRTDESGITGSKRIVLRGLVILLTGQIFETPVLFLTSGLPPARVSLNQISAPPPNDGSALYWPLITLTGLGLTLIVCGFLMRLRPWCWLVVSAVCVIATHSLLPASGRPGPWWETILLTPGLSQHLLVIYPVVPWLAVAALGMYFGYWWRDASEQARCRVWLAGVALVVAAVAIRAAGGWGNIRPPRAHGLIEFLNNVKYPPSLVFWTMSLGIDLLLLALLMRLPEMVRSYRSPLIVFGQTPLFFYITHFYVLALCAFAFFHEPATLQGAWFVWAVVVAALYPVCYWYRGFKIGKPRDSFWRLF